MADGGACLNPSPPIRLAAQPAQARSIQDRPPSAQPHRRHHQRPTPQHHSARSSRRHCQRRTPDRTPSHIPGRPPTRTRIPTHTRIPARRPIPHHNPVPHHRRPINHTLNLRLRTRRKQIQHIAQPRHRSRDLILRRPTRARALSAVVRARRHIPRRDILAEQRAVENPIRGLGLVGGDFVAGFEDAAEGQVAVLAD